MTSPVITTLADLVRIDSVNPEFGGPGEGGVADYVDERLRSAGIETRRTEVLPGRDNVVGIVPGRDRTRQVVLEAHMDVVSIAGMTIPPFAPVIDGGRMYGRGSCDTKAGLAGMLHAVIDIHRSGLTPPCDIWLAAVIDEEYLFRGVTRLCDDLPTTHASLTRRAAIIAEPTEMRVVVATKGVVRWEIVFHGRAAHSSKPHLGINAISHAATFIRLLQPWAWREDVYDHRPWQLKQYRTPRSEAVYADGTKTPRAKTGRRYGMTRTEGPPSPSNGSP